VFDVPTVVERKEYTFVDSRGWAKSRYTVIFFSLWVLQMMAGNLSIYYIPTFGPPCIIRAQLICCVLQQ